MCNGTQWCCAYLCLCDINAAGGNAMKELTLENPKGFVRSIARHKKKRAALECIRSVAVTQENGLEGDIRGKGGHDRARQVVIISWQGWLAARKDLGLDDPKLLPSDHEGDSLPWTLRRGNVLVDGLTFGKSDIGRQLAFGDRKKGPVFEITGEVTPCKRMDEQYPGLTAALTPNWRGGAACRIIRAGNLYQGMSVVFI